MGRMWLTAVGQTSGRTASATFTEGPLLVLQPFSGSEGTTVDVTGYGFGASETVQVRWNTPSGAVLASGVTNTQGTISTFITVPSGATMGKDRGLGVRQPSSALASAPFTVTLVATTTPSPNATSTPSVTSMPTATPFPTVNPSCYSGTASTISGQASGLVVPGRSTVVLPHLIAQTQEQRPSTRDLSPSITEYPCHRAAVHGPSQQVPMARCGLPNTSATRLGASPLPGRSPPTPCFPHGQHGPAGSWRALMARCGSPKPPRTRSAHHHRRDHHRVPPPLAPSWTLGTSR